MTTATTTYTTRCSACQSGFSRVGYSPEQHEKQLAELHWVRLTHSQEVICDICMKRFNLLKPFVAELLAMQDAELPLFDEVLIGVEMAQKGGV